MSHWNVILALSSSGLLSRDCILANKMVGRGGLKLHFHDLHRIPVCLPFLLFQWHLRIQAGSNGSAEVCPESNENEIPMLGKGSVKGEPGQGHLG